MCLVPGFCGVKPRRVPEFLKKFLRWKVIVLCWLYLKKGFSLLTHSTSLSIDILNFVLSSDIFSRLTSVLLSKWRITFTVIIFCVIWTLTACRYVVQHAGIHLSDLFRATQKVLWPSIWSHGTTPPPKPACCRTAVSGFIQRMTGLSWTHAKYTCRHMQSESFALHVGCVFQHDRKRL